MNQLQEILIPAIIFYAIVAVVKIIVDSRLKHKLIDKGIVDETAKAVFEPVKQFSPLSSVKWGLLLVSVGAALMMIQILPRYFSDEGAVGLLFIAAGAALFVNHFVERQARDRLSSEAS